MSKMSSDINTTLDMSSHGMPKYPGQQTMNRTAQSMVDPNKAAGLSLLKNNFARKNDNFIGYNKVQQKSGNHFYYGQTGNLVSLNGGTGTNVTSKASTIPNRAGLTKLVKGKKLDQSKLMTNPSIQSIDETIQKHDSQLGIYDALVVENVSKYK